MLRSIKYGFYGLVMAGMVAVPVVWNGVDKTVHLTVDGRSSTVSTTADHVGDLLSDRGYRPDGHDLVAPATGATLRDGMHVVLRRGRLLHLNVDGRDADIWTTAPTVAAALQQLGYSAADFVSVSRSRRLPLSPTDIAIRSMRTVTVIHDGITQELSTTEPTVTKLLSSLAIAVHPADRMNVAMSAPVTDGQTIVVQRVTSATQTKMIDLKYSVKTRSDASMTVGDTEVITSGRRGKARVEYSLVYVDGRLVGRTLVGQTVLSAPRTKVVAIGTKKKRVVANRAASASASASASPSSGSSGSSDPAPNTPIPSGNSPSDAKKIAKAMLARRGWSDQFSCVDNIFSRESGWRVHAQNSGSGAYGIPQALPGSKMGSAGSDWQDSAETQIRWGLNYMQARYHDPCGAWDFWQSHNYY